MDNVVTTKCSDCIFMSQGCKLNKAVFNFDGQYTEGFCRFKRNSKWAEQYKGSRLDNKIEHILKEELKLTVIVSCIEQVLSKIEATLDSIIINNSDHFVVEFVVVTFNYKAEMLQNLVELIKSKYKDGISWKLENVNHEETVDHYFSMDYGVELVTKSNWFIFVPSGELLTIKILEFIKSILSFKSNNILCLFFDLKDDHKIVANKSAFIELRGNLEIPWFQKIRYFLNWEKVCIKID